MPFFKDSTRIPNNDDTIILIDEFRVSRFHC